MLMFPEGERTHTGEVQPLKPGVSLLIKRVTCPIVPVGVAGAYQAWPRQSRWPRLDPLLLASRGRGIGRRYSSFPWPAEAIGSVMPRCSGAWAAISFNCWQEPPRRTP